MRVVKLCMLLVAMLSMPMQGPSCEVFQVTEFKGGTINNAWNAALRVADVGDESSGCVVSL
jgi:hypothetical protein